MMRSKYGKVSQQFGLCKTVGGGDSTATVADLQGFKSCWLSILVGAFAFTTTNKLTLNLLDSSDNTTFGTVAHADLEGEEVSGTTFKVWDVSASEASTAFGIHYRGNKRYLKAILVEGGTVSVAASVCFVLGDQDMSPSID